jgi:hypothetical protein
MHTFYPNCPYPHDRCADANLDVPDSGIFLWRGQPIAEKWQFMMYPLGRYPDNIILPGVS